MDYDEILDAFNCFHANRYIFHVWDMEQLYEGFKTLSNYNIFFEDIHVSLAKKDPELLVEKAWVSFLEYNKEAIDLYYTGIPTRPYDKDKTINERKEYRQIYHNPERLKTLFLNKPRLGFCKNCGNLRIHFIGLCKKPCRHCKGNRINRHKDKQFFSNLSLLQPKLKDIKPPSGYQSIDEWAKSVGITKQKASYLINRGRVLLLCKGRNLFIKKGEPLPSQKYKTIENQLIKELLKTITSMAQENPSTQFYYNPHEIKDLILYKKDTSNQEKNK